MTYLNRIFVGERSDNSINGFASGKPAVPVLLGDADLFELEDFKWASISGGEQ
jgi:hypothetical protein